jgi:hypothetical protein
MLDIKSLGFDCYIKITELYDKEMIKTNTEESLVESVIKTAADKNLHMINFQPTLELIDKSRIHSELWMSLQKMIRRRKQTGSEFEFCFEEQLPLIEKAFPSFDNLPSKVEKEYMVTKITTLYDKLIFRKEFAPHQELFSQDQVQTFLDNKNGLVEGCKNYSDIFSNELDLVPINISVLSELLSVGTTVGCFPLVGFLFAHKAIFALGSGGALCCCSQLCLELDLRKVFSNTVVQISQLLYSKSQAACASIYKKAYIVAKSQAMLFFKNRVSLLLFTIAPGTWLLYGSLGSSVVCTTNSTTNFQKETNALQATIMANVYHALPRLISSFCKDVVVAGYDDGIKILKEIIKGNGR